MSQHLSDLFIPQQWPTLTGLTIDVAVCGSIAALESPRFIRCLRRLSAEVIPWLSRGGSQFVTETSLSWASGGKPVITEFSGAASHIATHDALVIAPASANIISKIVTGCTDSPIAALAASYLGCNRPVLVLPTMHGSLERSPWIQENIARLASKAFILPVRRQEGKVKFPSPRVLADEVAHLLNRSRWTQQESVLLTMGSTRGAIDMVRYVSNFSSGRLGSMLAEELYRRGLRTVVVSGPCLRQPRVSSQLLRVETNAEMQAAAVAACHHGRTVGVFAAAVLDFIPRESFAGKIKSQQESLMVELQRAPKVISACHPSSGLKVGFKLEMAAAVVDPRQLAEEYCQREGLSLFVLNFWEDIAAGSHTAMLFARQSSGKTVLQQQVRGKKAIATAIADHIEQGLSRK